jgi:hypothetical protein
VGKKLRMGFEEGDDWLEVWDVGRLRESWVWDLGMRQWEVCTNGGLDGRLTWIDGVLAVN